MTLLTCTTVRRRLASFYDRELPVRELIAIENHLSGCPPCARELDEIRELGDALRLAAAPAPADDWKGLQPGVISRMRAEAHESWSARTKRLFEDMHLVWIALASTAATFLCGTIALSVLHFASPERNDSLAAVMAVMAAPSGSNLNPRRLDNFIRVPTMPEGGGVVQAMLEGSASDSMTEEELLWALSAVVTREGKIAGLSVLTNDHDRQQLISILDAIREAHLEPARFGNSPVAVNLVWLVAHTTVKGKLVS